MIDNLLRFADDRIQMRLALKAFRINLVNVFRAGRPGREPSAGRHHLKPTDRRAISGGASKLSGDSLAAEAGFLHGIR